MSSDDLITWLQAQNHYPKFIWQTEDTALAGSGAALTSGSFCFGVLPFRPLGKDALWRGFPETSFFFTPLIVRQGTIENGDGSCWKLKKMERSPDFEQWKKSCDHVLERIRLEELKKVVLARRVSYMAEAALDPFAIFRKLTGKIRFFLQVSAEKTFLGATPERLYQRSGRAVICDAVAGTTKKGSGLDLLSSPKELHEFGLVKAFLEKEVQKVSEKLSWEREDHLLEAGSLQHLHNRLRAELKSGVRDWDLIALLNPTPAIGGFPKEAALRLLEDLEPFERGLYASPIGWISDTGADFAIGIRSALILKNQMHLFSGAGIVEGSNPRLEWDELDSKVSQFTRFFYE